METQEEQDISKVKVLLKCDSCEFSTFWPRSLQCHRMVHTGGDKPYYCKYCNFSTRYNYSLRRHVKKKHFVFDSVMTIADNEILEFLSENVISTPSTQSSEGPKGNGTVDNTKNGRCSSYTNLNIQNGISSSAVITSNYQDDISSCVVSKNCQSGASNIFVRNNCENLISSSIASKNYQGGSFFINNFGNGISSSYRNNSFKNGISRSVGNNACPNEIGSNFVSNNCQSVISSSIVSNKYQGISSSFFVNNLNNFHNESRSGFNNNNNCVNEVSSSTFSNNFQNGISSIFVNSNCENVISSCVVNSKNYQNTRRNSDSFVSNKSTNYVENSNETLSTEFLSRPKQLSVGNELNPENDIIVFVCELCGFECSSADVCYNHAAEHQTNVFSPSWVTACADVL